MIISILNLYVLDASSNPHPSHGRNVFGHCHMASGGQNCPDLELTVSHRQNRIYANGKFCDISVMLEQVHIFKASVTAKMAVFHYI